MKLYADDSKIWTIVDTVIERSSERSRLYIYLDARMEDEVVYCSKQGGIF